jgi:hypothetical protein
MNIEARWSYIPQEIIWDAQFVDMVERKKRFEIDFSKLSQYQIIKKDHL